MLTPGNFDESGGFKPKSGSEKYYAATPPREYVLRRGDLVIAMTEQAEGLLGSSALIPMGDTYLHNQRIGLVESRPEDADRRFLYYLFNTRGVRDQIQASATGSKVRHTAPARVENVFVYMPPLAAQRKIAAILSAYDDLIENNNRRIRLLEEMAERIYREWFVDFRYPGHDGVRLVDSDLGSIPEGWGIGVLHDVLASTEAGSRPKGGIDPSERGVPSVGAENVTGLGRYDFGKEKFVSRSFFSKMTRGRIASGDVVLYKDGAYIGRVSLFRDGFPHSECSVNEHVFILRTNEKLSQSLLYFWLAHPSNQVRVRALNANAAQPGLNQEKLRALQLVIPSPHLVHRFTDTVEPILGLLFRLALGARIARTTRDLLLPGLVSGEIDVADRDIATPEAAA